MSARSSINPLSKLAFSNLVEAGDCRESQRLREHCRCQDQLYTLRTVKQNSPPSIGGVPERSEGGVVDQVPKEILRYESDLPPRLAVARRPLLFQEGSFCLTVRQVYRCPESKGQHDRDSSRDRAGGGSIAALFNHAI